MSTLVSIIVPVYNTEKYLNQAITSILNQTHCNLEVICVDDGSTDSSLAILQSFQSQDSRIKIIHQENQGLSSARNNALKSVKGTYICFIDSDDWIDSDCIEKALQKAQTYQADIVMWGYIREGENSSKVIQVWTEDKVFKDDDLKKLHLRLLSLTGCELQHIEQMDSLGTACFKLYASHLFLNNQITYTDLNEIGSGEDVLANQALFRYAKCACYTSEILYHYRRNPTSLTNTYKPNLISQWRNLFNLMSENYRDYIPHKLAEDALNNRIALSLHTLALNILSSTGGQFKKYQELQQLLISPWYRTAVYKLSLRYMPLHWKIYYGSAKLKLTGLVYILSKIISKIRYLKASK